MGLFNKLKNALFEEDIEVPIEPTNEEKSSKKEEEKVAPVAVEEKKEIKKPNVFLEEENERELFKAENTFKFPDFDEEEFQSSYQKVIEKEEEKEKEYLTPKERFDRVKPVSYELDKRSKPTPKETKVEKKEPVKKTFTPSPVISPVYGILDKNYKKEDIVTVSKKEEKPKKKFDIDAIRKKAFGTLEDDIERTIDAPADTFYEEKEEVEKKPSRESKKENLQNTIEVPKIDSRMEKRSARHPEEYEEEDYSYDEVEEPIREQEPIKEEKRFEEDTLENDLFDLIDSMYDNREEDDE